MLAAEGWRAQALREANGGGRYVDALLCGM